MHSSLIYLSAVLLGSAAAWPHKLSNNTTSASYPTSSSSEAETHTTYKPYPTGTGSHGSYGTGSTHPTPSPSYTYPNGPETTVYTKTLTSFVPCSTLVSSQGFEPYYSTYLTASYYTTCITSTVDSHPTPAPYPGPDNNNNNNHGDYCPPATTVTETVYASEASPAPAGPPCHECKTYAVTYTYTATLPHGGVTTKYITETETSSPTGVPSPTTDYTQTYPTGTGTGAYHPPAGTGAPHYTKSYSYSAPRPSGTGAAKWW